MVLEASKMFSITGGLRYALDVDTILSGVLQLMVCAGYTFVCLKTSQTVQIKVGVFQKGFTL